VPEEGGLIEVNYITKHKGSPPPMVRRIRGWDKAATHGDGDYSCGALIGVDTDKNYWILDIVLGQWSATVREAKILETAERDGRDVQIQLEQEGGSGGKESAESTVRNLAGFYVEFKTSTGDKASRAYGFRSQVGAGNVMIMDDPRWTQRCLDEMAAFPNGVHDDIVDAIVTAFNKLSLRRVRIGAL
jgi:predicted phage terminase large subunit-like protein